MVERSHPPEKPGPKPRPALRESDIQGLKHLPLLRGLLGALHDHAECPNRKLHYDEYASLLMLYFLNPVLQSLRSIQQASGLRNVQKRLGVSRASLGSLSEASRVFDPDLLGEIVQQLGDRAAAADGPQRVRGVPVDRQWVAIDGALLDALPRMVWAVWLDEEHRAAKMHLEFNILKSVPQAATVTDGNTPERDVLRERLGPNKLYVMDRHFMDYRLLDAMRDLGSSFVCRLRENASAPEVLEERPLTEADRAAGVVFDRVVRLGSSSSRHRMAEPVRLVQIHAGPAETGRPWRPRSKVARRKPRDYRPKPYDVLLVTDLMAPCAADVGTIYRHRWTVELFFRWFKCVLGFSHLVCESSKGVQILVYCALIVSLLIVLWTGRKPTKRTLEMIQLYFQGWAEVDEVEAHIAALKKADA